MANKSPKEEYRYCSIGEVVMMDAMASQQGHLNGQKPEKKSQLKNVTPKEPVQLELPFEEARLLQVCRKCAKRMSDDEVGTNEPKLPLFYERFLAWQRDCMCLSCYKETNTAPLRTGALAIGGVYNDC